MTEDETYGIVTGLLIAVGLVLFFIVQVSIWAGWIQ